MVFRFKRLRFRKKFTSLTTALLRIRSFWSSELWWGTQTPLIVSIFHLTAITSSLVASTERFKCGKQQREKKLGIRCRNTHTMFFASNSVLALPGFVPQAQIKPRSFGARKRKQKSK